MEGSVSSARTLTPRDIRSRRQFGLAMFGPNHIEMMAIMCCYHSLRKHRDVSPTFYQLWHVGDDACRTPSCITIYCVLGASRRTEKMRICLRETLGPVDGCGLAGVSRILNANYSFICFRRTAYDLIRGINVERYASRMPMMRTKALGYSFLHSSSSFATCVASVHPNMGSFHMVHASYVAELQAGNPFGAEKVLDLLEQGLVHQRRKVGEGLELLLALDRPHLSTTSTVITVGHCYGEKEAKHEKRARYLHALDSATVAGEVREVSVVLPGDREGGGGLEAGEGRDHAGLSRGSPGGGGGGGGGGYHHGGSHSS
ncbi:hypothetical protein GW17_00010251 [Ensete ventricosum]|nr:hypothetical protein GW17_00010251 [Ensete ventricosum]